MNHAVTTTNNKLITVRKALLTKPFVGVTSRMTENRLRKPYEEDAATAVAVSNAQPLCFPQFDLLVSQLHPRCRRRNYTFIALPSSSTTTTRDRLLCNNKVGERARRQ